MAQRGFDLATRAAADLQRWADVDAGFFVYQRRAVGPEVAESDMDIYAPWGPVGENVATVRPMVLGQMHRLGKTERWMERWISWRQVPDPWETSWSGWDLKELGVWPIVSQGRAKGILVVGRTQSAPNRVDKGTRRALVDVCASQVSQALDLLLATRRAEEMGRRDWLTGVFNRRGFLEYWASLPEAAAAAGQSLVIGLVDVDHLKRINDEEGHPAGDRAINEVAQVLLRSLGSDDLLARWGGDEFLVAMRVDTADAPRVMARIKGAVARESAYTVSVGGAVWLRDGASWEDCYRVADKALYEDKRRSQP